MNARQPAALKMYIGGCWVESESGKPFEALNPAAGQVIATLPEGTREDTRWAITAANAASAEHRHVHLGPLPPLRAYCWGEGAPQSGVSHAAGSSASVANIVCWR